MRLLRCPNLLPLVGAVAMAAPALAEEGRAPGAAAGSNGITFSAGALELNLGGRLYLDAGDGRFARALAAFHQHQEVRQARVEVEATIADAWTIAFRYDFADEDDHYKDLIIAYAGERFAVSAGNLKEPFSLEELTSDNDLDLMERSLASAFSPGRAFGAVAMTGGDRWTVTGGVFGGNVNDSATQNGTAVSARAMFAPVLEGREVVHLGASASYRAFGERVPQFSASPESNLFEAAIVDTGDLAEADRLVLLGAEAAWQTGRLRLQGEYVFARIEQGGAPDADLHGGYALAALVLNGEGRSYRTDIEAGSETGVFEGVEIDDRQRLSRGGAGVFEAVARASVIDLDDGAIEGGRAGNLGIGLNWYPEKNVRVMANYIHARAWDAPETGGDETADVVQVRLQLAY